MILLAVGKAPVKSDIRAQMMTVLIYHEYYIAFSFRFPIHTLQWIVYLHCIIPETDSFGEFEGWFDDRSDGGNKLGDLIFSARRASIS